jgi:hypothetical protein
VISNHTSRLALAIALMTGVVGTASAAESRSALPQRANVTTDLGNNVSAFTYWVDEADGIHVVTTIDAVVGGEAVPEQDRHAIVRFSALILPGQSQVISVPGLVGSQSQALRIRRLGNRFGTFDIEVDRIPEPGPNVLGASQPHPDRRSDTTPVRDATGPKLPLLRGR